MKTSNLKLLVAACGTTLGMANIANAQALVNISGATLFTNFFRAGSSTVDFIDVDGDNRSKTCAGQFVDQLANPISPFPPSFSTDDTLPGQFWIVQYFSVGSVNGFQDLANFGSPKPVMVSADRSPTAASLVVTNREVIYQASPLITSANRNTSNPYGAPVVNDATTFAPNWTLPGTPTPGGIRVDIAPLDVDPFWGQQFAGGTPVFSANPGEPGYGRNPNLPTDKNGVTVTTGGSQQLVDLTAANRTLFEAANPGTPDANTIFGTPIVYNTVAALTNLGTGIREIRQSDLRHMNATGRMRSGENLVQITRETGSGTRNAFVNSICLDPSWGVGEAVGGDNAGTAFNLAGPGFIPSNKVGSGDVENTIYNTRIGFGYTGTERFTNNSLVGRIEIMAVKPDIINGSDAVGTFARPSAFNQVNNLPLRGDNTSGYMIGGVQTFATVGDPKSAPAAVPCGTAGGNKGGVAGNPWPAMTNPEAAAYINNITASVAAFTDNPLNNANTSTPGEFIGINFILISAPDRLQTQADPCTWVANGAQTTLARNYAISSSLFATNAAYATFGTAGLNGRVPTRQTGVTYSDGATGANNFYNLQGGGTLTYAAGNVNDRNRIAGDFNGDALRNVNDIGNMVAAWRQRNGGPAWIAPAGNATLNNAAGSLASIEILGDFNSDGNFNTQDVRYFADGLAMSGGVADRKAGYTGVDAAFGGNFFGTTKATPAVYANGDSRGDIAGGAGQTPNFQPIGQDGVVNGADIDYVYKQFKTNPRVTDGVLNWDNTAEAVLANYSANMTSGDTNIDINDVCEIVRGILGTKFGDVNLDGSVTCADLAVINQAGLPYAGGWAQGDVNGDGHVTAADVAVIRSNLLTGDINGDGTVNTADLTGLLAVFGQNVPCDSLVNITGSGTVNTATLTGLLANFGQSSSCP